MGWCASHLQDAERGQTGLGNGLVLRLAATGDTDCAYALTAFQNRQAAAKGNKARA